MLCVYLSSHINWNVFEVNVVFLALEQTKNKLYFHAERTIEIVIKEGRTNIHIVHMYNGVTMPNAFHTEAILIFYFETVTCVLCIIIITFNLFAFNTHHHHYGIRILFILKMWTMYIRFERKLTIQHLEIKKFSRIVHIYAFYLSNVPKHKDSIGFLRYKK